MCGRREPLDGVKPAETDVVELLQELIACDSSDPGAYEGAIEKLIGNWIREKVAGYHLEDVVEIRELEALPGRRCLMALIPSAGEKNLDTTDRLRAEDAAGAAGDAVDAADAALAGATDPESRTPREPERADGLQGRLFYVCHMDTVTLGDGWSEDIGPLSGKVADGQVWGRGACDMKGGLACALLALDAVMRAVAERGQLPPRGFGFMGTVDEEDFMRGIEAILDAGWIRRGDWLLDTEPTDGRARISHKGRTWFEVDVHGVTAHASTPWKGVDAVAAMAEFICALRREVEALPVHPELGRATITFGQVEGGYRPYVVPDGAKVWIDMRLVPPADTPWAEEAVERAAAAMAEAVPGARATWKVTGDRPPIERDPASQLLAALEATTERVCGDAAPIDIFTGYTDTAVVAGKTGMREFLSYGPGSLEVAHKPDEHVPVADLVRVRDVLRDLALTTCWQLPTVE